MKTLTFKVTDDEARRIRNSAKRENLTVSEFLRRRADDSVIPSAPLVKTVCEFTGAEIFAPLPGQIPLTTESVRAMLGEFP